MSDPVSVVSDLAYASVGLWLLVLRPVVTKAGLLGGNRGEPRWAINNLLMQVACGFSLALYGPMLLWFLPSWSTLLLGMLGILLSVCDFWFFVMAFIAAVSVGFGCACIIWQLGACLTPVIVHIVLLVCAAVVSLSCFVFRRPPVELSPDDQTIWLWSRVEFVLFPLLGALLLTAGSAGLVADGVLGESQMGLLGGVLPPATLVSAEVCPAASGDQRPAALFLAVWLGSAAIGGLLQKVLMTVKCQCWRSRADDEASESLVANLLTINDNKDSDHVREGESMTKPELGQMNDRFRIICTAFHDPDMDLSQLTETERKIVEICRKDEFERDRYMWGGGLI